MPGTQPERPGSCNYLSGMARISPPRPIAAPSRTRPCTPPWTQLPPSSSFCRGRTANRRSFPRSVDRNRGRSFGTGLPGRRSTCLPGNAPCSRLRCVHQVPPSRLDGRLSRDRSCTSADPTRFDSFQPGTICIASFPRRRTFPRRKEL